MRRFSRLLASHVAAKDRERLARQKWTSLHATVLSDPVPPAISLTATAILDDESLRVTQFSELDHDHQNKLNPILRGALTCINEAAAAKGYL